MVVSVDHRHHSQVGLFVSFLLWKLAWYQDSQNPGIGHSGQFQLRSLWALFLNCMVSSAIRTQLLPLGDTSGNSTILYVLRVSKTALANNPKESISSLVLGFMLGGLWLPKLCFQAVCDHTAALKVSSVYVWNQVMIFDNSHNPLPVIQPDTETIFQVLAQDIPTPKLTAWDIPTLKFTLYMP